MKEGNSSTKCTSCRNYSFFSEVGNYISPENFGRKLRRSVYVEINLSLASNPLDGIHSAASHAACIPLLWLQETWSLCGCTFWKCPTVAYIHVCLLVLSVTRTVLVLDRKAAPSGKLPHASSSWRGTGLRWVRIFFFFSCMTRSYGLFLWQKHMVRSSITDKGLSLCSPDVLFPHTGNWRSLLSLSKTGLGQILWH